MLANSNKKIEEFIEYMGLMIPDFFKGPPNSRKIIVQLFSVLRQYKQSSTASREVASQRETFLKLAEQIMNTFAITIHSNVSSFI